MLNELKVKKQYQIKISNRFTAFKKLNDREDINRAWENMKMRTSIPHLKRLYVCTD
jgi:hypothetical protein